MDNSGEIKIRALPRSNEDADGKKSGQDKPQQPEQGASPSRRWIIYVGTSAVLLAALGVMLHSSPKHTTKTAAGKAQAKAQGQTDLASVNARINTSVTRHLQDAEIQAEMMKRTREMENEPFKNAINERNDGDESVTMPEPDGHAFGVQLESDNAAERVYEDLNGGPRDFSDTLPGDKINNKIANRKWMNEMERNEKIQFISAFIRSAYDKGYEVQIDQNLVVVGVKKINKNKILDINQVIDRLAKGQQPGSG